jgi:hypothetical protein
VIIKTHAVQGCLIFSQTKQPGAGVSWLRVKRHCAEFGKAKTKGTPDSGSNTILIEPSG